MRSTCYIAGRVACLLLALCLLCGGLVACGGGASEVPDGYQYATCNGEYFRLFVPTQWTVNTESGVSGGYTSVFGEVAVSMVEVPFDRNDRPAETETAAETAAADRTATLADFFDAHMADIATLRDYKHEKTADTTMSASDGGKRAAAKDITYTASVAGTVYRYRQVLCKVEGRFYLFTSSYSAAYFDALPEDQQLKITSMIEEILGNIVFHARPFDGGTDDRKLPRVEAPEGMKLVTDNTVAYRFFAPESWIAVPGSAAAQVCASETDRSNVSVISFVPDEEGVGVEDYWTKTQLHYESALGDYRLVSTVSEGETMGGRNATVYEYTYTLGGVSYHARQAVCVYGDMIISMTYTALEANYSAHLDEVKAMQAALTFRSWLG